MSHVRSPLLLTVRQQGRKTQARLRTTRLFQDTGGHQLGMEIDGCPAVAHMAQAAHLGAYFDQNGDLRDADAISAAESTRVLHTADVANAFQTPHRTKTFDAVKRDMPELSPYVRLLYRGPTSFFVAGSDSNERVISSRGATQGCALGSLLHCLVSREPLMQYVTEIRKLDPDAMVLSIIDDVETVCDGVKVPLAKATDLLNEAMATVGVTYHGLDSDKGVTFRPHSAFHGEESTVLPPPPLSTITHPPSDDELRAFISLLAAEEPKLERRAAATNGSQGSQQRFEQQRCKDVPSALRCLHIAPRGLRAVIASVNGASGRAAKVVALATSQQRKLRMHVHPDRLTTPSKEALGDDLLNSSS